MLAQIFFLTLKLLMRNCITLDILTNPCVQLQVHSFVAYESVQVIQFSSAKNLSCSRGENYGSFKKREYRATSTQHRREKQNTHATRLARSLIYLELWS